MTDYMPPLEEIKPGTYLVLSKKYKINWYILKYYAAIKGITPISDIIPEDVHSFLEHYDFNLTPFIQIREELLTRHPMSKYVAEAIVQAYILKFIEGYEIMRLSPALKTVVVKRYKGTHNCSLETALEQCFHEYIPIWRRTYMPSLEMFSRRFGISVYMSKHLYMNYTVNTDRGIRMFIKALRQNWNLNYFSYRELGRRFSISVTAIRNVMRHHAVWHSYGAQSRWKEKDVPFKYSTDVQEYLDDVAQCSIL